MGAGAKGLTAVGTGTKGLFLKNALSINQGGLYLAEAFGVEGAVAAGAGTVVAKVGASAADEVVDLFRAVGPDEFYDIFRTLKPGEGVFREGPGMIAKQFGRDFHEILELTDHLKDTAAIVKARVPQSVVDQLDQTPVDRVILRSGTVSVWPDKLELFNSSLLSVEHVY